MAARLVLDGRPAALPPNFADWSRRHRLAPLLYEKAPDKCAELREDWLTAHAQTLARRSFVAAFVEAATSDQVELTFFKGLGVAVTAYPNPEVRPLGDVDVLVRRNDAIRAVELLESMGFERLFPDPEEQEFLHTHHYQIPLVHPLHGVVELHHGLYRELPSSFSEECMSRSTPAQFGPPVGVAPLEELFVVLAVHLSHNGGTPHHLWWVDLILLSALDEFDPDRLVAVATESGCAIHVLAADQALGRWWHKTIGISSEGRRELHKALVPVEAAALRRAMGFISQAEYPGDLIRLAQRGRLGEGRLRRDLARVGRTVRAISGRTLGQYARERLRRLGRL